MTSLITRRSHSGLGARRIEHAHLRLACDGLMSSGWIGALFDGACRALHPGPRLLYVLLGFQKSGVRCVGLLSECLSKWRPHPSLPAEADLRDWAARLEPGTSARAALLGAAPPYCLGDLLTPIVEGLASIAGTSTSLTLVGCVAVVARSGVVRDS